MHTFWRRRREIYFLSQKKSWKRRLIWTQPTEEAINSLESGLSWWMLDRIKKDRRVSKRAINWFPSKVSVLPTNVSSSEFRQYIYVGQRQQSELAPATSRSKCQLAWYTKHNNFRNCSPDNCVRGSSPGKGSCHNSPTTALSSPWTLSSWHKEEEMISDF